jgi:hypothetical protein
MQKDPKHLLLAYLFDKPCFLGVLAIQVTLIFFSLTLGCSFGFSSMILSLSLSLSLGKHQTKE